MQTGLCHAKMESLMAAEAGELAAAVDQAAAGSVKAMEVAPAHQRPATSGLAALLEAAASAWGQDLPPSGTRPCPIASPGAAASHPATGGKTTTAGQAGSAKESQAGITMCLATAEKSPAGAETGTGQAASGSAHAEATTISARPGHTASPGPTVGPVPAAAAVPQGGAPAVANALQAQAGAFSQAIFSNAALYAGGTAGIAPQPDAGQPAQVPPVPPFPFPAFSGLAFMVQHTASWLPQGIADEAQRQEFAASLQKLGKDLDKPRKHR